MNLNLLCLTKDIKQSLLTDETMDHSVPLVKKMTAEVFGKQFNIE